LVNPAAAQAFLLRAGKRRGVNGHAAFGTAQRNVGHRGFPCHPHGKGAHGVDGFLGVEADTALGRAAGVIVLHPVAVKSLDVAVIHSHRNLEAEFPHGPAQHLGDIFVQAQQIGHVVELLLSHFESIHHFAHSVHLSIFLEKDKRAPSGRVPA